MDERGRTNKTDDPDLRPRAAEKLPDDGRVTRKVVEALSQGNHEAYSIVYLTYQAHIQNFVSNFLNNPDMGEEITQELFTYLWEKHHTIDPARSLKAFLFRIARRRAVDYIRLGVRYRTVELTRDAEEEMITTHTAPDQYLLQKELDYTLKLHIEAMPGQRRKVYELALEGLSTQQIAERLNLDMRNVQQHIRNARKSIGTLHTLFTFFLVLP